AGIHVDAVALVPSLERDGQLRLRAIDDCVRESVNVRAARRLLTTEIRMQVPCAAVVDIGNETRRVGVDWRGTDIQVPPVVGGKYRQRRGRRCALDRNRSRALLGE